MDVEQQNARAETGGDDLPPPVCPACGKTARRAAARYCSTCGRALDRGGYAPADALRSSYHQQHGEAAFSAEEQSFGGDAARKLNLKLSRSARVDTHDFAAPAGGGALGRLAARRGRGLGAAARTFIVYALVPYLGILFCPVVIMMGGAALAREAYAPQSLKRGDSFFIIVLGVLILGAQVFLWWVLFRSSAWPKT